MKVLLVGDDASTFLSKVRSSGLELVQEDPDLIIAYGGDGTLIGAERDHPGVPKLGIRSDSTCRKCPVHRDEVVLERLRAGDLQEHRLMKLEVERNGARLLAMNDVIIRNADLRAAVRFVVYLNGQPVTEEMIGDGLVACTPFGSSAYFRSITRMVIRVGIGLAFNNCTDLLNHLVFGDDEVAEVAMTRGPGTLAADNDAETIPLQRSDRIRIRRAEAEARIVAVDTLRCTQCRYVHAPRRRY